MADPIIIRYSPRSDATRQAETEALANVFAFLIERAEKRKAAGAKSGGEERGGDNDRESRAPLGWQGRPTRSVAETSAENGQTK